MNMNRVFVIFIVLILLLSSSLILIGQQVNASRQSIHHINRLPYTITESGTYILDTDAYAAADKNAITIEASSVVLNGNGHMIKGDGVGISAENVSNVSIENMRIAGGLRDGIYLSNFSNGNIYNNTINNRYLGVVMHDSSDNNIYGNKISKNKIGIVLYTSSNNRIYSNIVSNSGGIVLYSSSDNNLIYNNMVRKNYDGLCLVGSSNNIIHDNMISGNTYGIGLLGSSNNNFYHNDFINNTVQVDSRDSVNVWDNGYPSGGNYWSDYSGIDSNGDGIGDTPYIVNNSNNNIDHYPLIKPFNITSLLPIKTVTTIRPTLTTTATVITTHTSHPSTVISATLITTHTTATRTSQANLTGSSTSMTNTISSPFIHPARKVSLASLATVVGIVIVIGIVITVLKKY